MQVDSSNPLAAQLRALENAALGQYKSDQDFSLLVDRTAAGGSGSSSGDGGGPGDAPGGYELSGSFSGASVVAVGTFGPDGTLNYFSPDQIKSEYDAVADARKSAYADALQNFMTLSQAGGQIGGGTFTDHQSFVADNGLVAGNFDTSLSLKPVGGAIPA